MSLNKIEVFEKGASHNKFTLLRRDIVDRNGIIISRNIKSYHAAINPKLIRNKDNFLIKLRIHFPEIQIKKIEKKNKSRKIFLL